MPGECIKAHPPPWRYCARLFAAAGFPPRKEMLSVVGRLHIRTHVTRKCCAPRSPAERRQSGQHSRTL